MEKFSFIFKVILTIWDILGEKDFVSLYKTKSFESNLSKYLGIQNIVGVASGTDALILSLKAIGINPDDEVIVPSLSFFSTAGVVAWINAVPVFVDVEEKSLNIDPALIERAITPKTKVIIAVHLNGRMADMEPILQIAKKHNLFLIEDAAQALGAKYKGKSPGFYGDLACFSFNPQKILTAGGDGGAIATNSTDIAAKIRLLQNYGAKFEEMGIKHSLVGTASRLSPFHAAVMNIKMAEIDAVINNRRKNYQLYSEELQGIKEITLPEIPDGQEYFINGYRYAILTSRRDELKKLLINNKVDAKTHYSVPLPYLGAFRYLGYQKGDFSVAEKISEKVLVLPTDNNVSEKEILQIAQLAKSFF